MTATACGVLHSPAQMFMLSWAQPLQTVLAHVTLENTGLTFVA